MVIEEAKKDKEWAEKTNKDKKWKKNASNMSLDMLKKKLDKTVPELAQYSYDYLKMRSHAKGSVYGQATSIDRAAKEKWEKLSGKEIE